MTPEQEYEAFENRAVAEELIAQHRQLGKRAADLLYRAQWQNQSPDWFDHRLHDLDPERWLKTHVYLCLCRVMMRLPVKGRVLDLCCGDCWSDRWFYAPRASDVLCIDRSAVALANADRYQSHPNIRRRHCTDLLEDPRVEQAIDAHQFDVVVMRGAIEHFTVESQPRVFALAKRAMKPSGWFIGDTCTDLRKGKFEHHERVYQSAAELQKDLEVVFSRVVVETFYDPNVEGSGDRTTFIWEAQ
jgi:SAM-dependent methyltransferase